MDTHILSLSRLGRAADTQFLLEPDADTRKRIARELSLRSLRKARLQGTLSPAGKHDWHLKATLGATAIQECVVTLEPVTTRIDTALTRSYLTDLPQPSGDDLAIPEDDTIEPLPTQVDLMALLMEALALLVPDYPRAAGVELGQAVFAPPGVAPLRDEDAKPLAGLAALRDKLQQDRQEPEKEG